MLHQESGIDERVVRGRSEAPIPPVYELDWTDPANMDDAELLAFGNGQYRAGKMRRYHWEARAAERLAWARGHQDLVWDDHTKDLVEEHDNTPMDQRDQIWINRMRGAILTMISLTVAQPMTWHVNAVTTDDADIFGADVGEDLLRYYWTVGDTLTRLIDAAWMLFAANVVFIKPVWDPFRGFAKQYGPNQILGPDSGATDEADKQRGVVNRVRKWVSRRRPAAEKSVDASGNLTLPGGDIYFDFAWPFDVTEPQHCASERQAAWLMDSRFRPVEYVRNKWPDTASDVMPTNRDQEFYNRFREQFGDLSRIGAETHSTLTPPDEVLVHEIWRPRLPQCPEGAKIVHTEDRVLEKGPHPYLHGEIPLIGVRASPEPEYFRPSGVGEDMMQAQRAMNRSRSAQQGVLHFAVDPRFLYEKDSGFPEDGLTPGPKAIGMKPDKLHSVKYLETPPLPAGVNHFDALLARDFDDVAGVHRSTTGRSESAQQSGKHAQLMFQADVRQQAPSRILMEQAFAKAGLQALWLAWEFVSEERATPIVGPDGRLKILKWKGRDLSSQEPFGPFAWNVRCELQPIENLGETLAKLRYMQEGGWLTPENPHHRAFVMRMLTGQMPTGTEIGEEHRTNARAEHETIVEGKPVPVPLGDDDQVHLEEHYQFTTKVRYRDAVERDPDVEVAMQWHIAEHQFNEADKANRAKAIASRVQAELVKEYGLRVQPRAPAAAGPGGAPGAPRALPVGGAPRPPGGNGTSNPVARPALPRMT